CYAPAVAHERYNVSLHDALTILHAQAFDTAGIKTGVVGHPRMKNNRVYPEGVSWTGQLGCLYISGATLLTTLLTNIWAVNLNETDRKSRSLNSSHITSSYAVFCW